MAKVSLITGITGQDGAYLAEFLLKTGYRVHGIKRRTSLFNTDRVDHLFHDMHEHGQPFQLHHGDLTDSSSLLRTLAEVRPDEIYNLAAQSHVAVSFEEPEYTANAVALGALRLLEAIRILKLDDRTRYYQASSSELSATRPKRRKTKRRRSTRVRLTRSPSFTPTGSPSTTARPMVCSPATVSCSTMKAPSAERPSSPARSHAVWRAS